METRTQQILATSSTRARRILRWLFNGLLILIVLPSGAVDNAVLHIFACGLIAVAAVAAIVGERNQAVQGAYNIALIVASLVGLWIMLQASTLPGHLFANPIWADAARLYGPMQPSISVAPGDTMAGLIAALLPFVVFLTVLLLFRSDEEALDFIRTIALSGSAICMIGVIQFLFFPDMLLFMVKKHYLGSLTAVFVNRNTAATYIAMIMIFTSALAYHHIQNGGLVSLFRFLVNAPSRTKGTDAILGTLYALASLMTLLALMLTQSRAGIASAMAGLLVMASIFAFFGSPYRSSTHRQSFTLTRAPIWVKLGRVALVFAILVAVGLTFAGQALLRAGVQGTADLRFCLFPSLLQLTADNWLVGTGLGTFPNVFPAYRNPSCSMEGVLTMAHNFYLEGWITLGLPFVFAAVVVIAALLTYLIIGLRNRRQYRWVPAAGLAVLVLQLAHNSVDFSIQNPGVAAIFAALIGAAIVVSRGRSAKTREAGRRAEHRIAAAGQ